MAIKPSFVLWFLIFATIAGNAQIAGKSETVRTSDNQFALLAAHRGGFDSDLPENSLALFNFTCSNTTLKPVILELDVRAGKSGSLFVMHDETLDRTTNGTGMIGEASDEYLNSLFLKDRNGKLTSQKIPLLLQVLETFKNTEVMLMLDVKGNIHSEVTALLKRTGLEKQCIMLTFKPETTQLCLAASSKVKISALVRNSDDWVRLKSLNIPADQLIVYFDKSIEDSLLEEIREENILLMTDMNETITNHGNPFSFETYSDLLIRRKPGILITDFPVSVARMIIPPSEESNSKKTE